MSWLKHLQNELAKALTKGVKLKSNEITSENTIITEYPTNGVQFEHDGIFPSENDDFLTNKTSS